MKMLFIIVAITSVILLFCVTVLTVHAQSDLQTTKYRNMTIDLGDGVKTYARLYLPANGDGPFPGVLLIHGSGGESVLLPTSPYTPIAEYLSERGFAVLQYNKRGIGENDTLDSNVWGNLTINDLKQDAEKALSVLLQQPEVNATKKATLIGHSEGTIITPRIAIDNPGKVKNVVLMAAIAQNMRDLVYFQGVTNPVNYAQQILDHNHNGLISVQEASENPVFSTLVGNLTLLLTKNITTANGTSKQLSPQFDVNNDTFVSIDEELKPRLIDRLRSLSVVTPGEKCVVAACPILLKSHYALQPPTSNIIGNISSNTSILILQGENDSMAPIQQVFLLQQELTEVNHPDHTLITYPDLGHWFYPSSQWLTMPGPIEPYVLADLYSWLESHSGLSYPYLAPAFSNMTSKSTDMGSNSSSSESR